MPRTEDGEYELVLGNRQLLSIFFIVVVLLGIGFTLGYILGRNSGGGPVTTEAALQQKVPETSAAADLPDPAPLEEAKASEPKSAESKPYEPSPAPVAETPKTSAKAAEKEKPATNKRFRTGAPPRGSVFIQVAAVSKVDAELEASTLAQKGYPTWVAPNPNNGDLFSVLVGPYEDKGELAKAKTGLEQLGFRKAFRKEIK